MHRSSMELMDCLLGQMRVQPGDTVLDCGARMTESGLQQSYRDLAKTKNLTYTGLDKEGGPNVDVVVDLESEKAPGRYDIVISGQMLEHVTQPLVVVQNMICAVKPRGSIVLIAPWEYGIHRVPVDCWRILPDGMGFLLSGCDEVKTGVKGKDCYGTARVPEGYRPKWTILRS